MAFVPQSMALSWDSGTNLARPLALSARLPPSPFSPSHLLCLITACSGVRFLGLLQHSAQNWDLKLTQFYSPTALEATRVQLGCRQVPEGPREELQASSWFLALPAILGVPWLVAASHWSLPLSSSAIVPGVSLCVPLQKNICPRIRVQPTPAWPPLNSVTSPKTSLPNKCTFTVP